MFYGHRLQSLIYVTLYYGLRRSEVLGLKWNAIDFQKNEISICHTVVRNLTVVSKDKTKSKAGKRKFELLPKVKEVLLKVRSDQ
jgi:integrase